MYLSEDFLLSLVPEQSKTGVIQQPPCGVEEYFKQRGFFDNGAIIFQHIALPIAKEKAQYIQDFRRNEKTKAALCQCSKCEEFFIAEYVTSVQGCWGAGEPCGIKDAEQHTVRNNKQTFCPVCGEEVYIQKYNGENASTNLQSINICVPIVRKGMCIFEMWVLRHMVEHENCNTYVESELHDVFVIDGKKMHRIAMYSVGMFGAIYKNDTPQLRKRCLDTNYETLLYNVWPNLIGTDAENAKLQEFCNQIIDIESDYDEEPVIRLVQYTRLWQQHKNVENLVTAGYAYMLNRSIISHDKGYYGKSQARVTLDFINWKAKKPHEMLGITKAELKQGAQEHWLECDVKHFVKCNKMRAIGATEKDIANCKNISIENVNSILAEDNPLRLLRYLAKQNKSYTYYTDYLNMAQRAGNDITQDIVRFPKRLDVAHDRYRDTVRYIYSPQQQQAFEEMSQRCQKLNWSNGEICIFVAPTAQSIIDEGITLQHCVGGYCQSHTNGELVLFVRHARRPERSWFTLQIDTKTKEQKQLHGFKNEIYKGKQLTIPNQVLQAIEQWKTEVLSCWKIAPKKRTQKAKTTRKTKSHAA